MLDAQLNATGSYDISTCFPRGQLARATLRGPELEDHYRQVLAATEEFRDVPYHNYSEYSGPWIENLWIERFCCETTRNASLFGRFVPLFVQWVDLFMQVGGPPANLGPGLRGLLREDVLYVTVSQHDDGVLYLEGFPNVLIFSAGGVGQVPIPLLKGDACVELDCETGPDLTAMFFYGQYYHHGPVRQVLREALDHMPKRSPLPLLHTFTGPHKEWLQELRRTRFVLAPRGHGRATFLLYEALQNGRVPVYVWNDIKWLAYGRLWSSNVLGHAIHISSIGEGLRRLSNVSHKEHRGRERSIFRHRLLFTYDGVLSQVITFLASDGAQGYLQCERRKPLRNDVGWRYLPDWSFSEALAAFFVKEAAEMVLDIGSGDGFIARTVAAQAGVWCIGTDIDPRVPPPRRYHNGGYAMFQQKDFTAPDTAGTLFKHSYEWVMSFGVADEVAQSPEPLPQFLKQMFEVASASRGIVFSWGGCKAAGGSPGCRRTDKDLVPLFQRFGYMLDVHSTTKLRRASSSVTYKDVHVFRRFLPSSRAPRQALENYFSILFRNGSANVCQADEPGTHLHWHGGEIWSRSQVISPHGDLRGEWTDSSAATLHVGCYSVTGADASAYPAAILDGSHAPECIGELKVIFGID